jgi:hypothetical protein
MKNVSFVVEKAPLNKQQSSKLIKHKRQLQQEGTRMGEKNLSASVRNIARFSP